MAIFAKATPQSCSTIEALILRRPARAVSKDAPDVSEPPGASFETPLTRLLRMRAE